MSERKGKFCIYNCRKEDCPAVFGSLPARKQHEKVYHPGEDLSHIKVPIEDFSIKEERDQRINALRRGYARPTKISKQVDEETSGTEEEIEMVLKDVVVPSKTTKVEQIEPIPEPEPKSKPEPEQIRIYKRKSITKEFFEWLDSDD